MSFYKLMYNGKNYLNPINIFSAVLKNVYPSVRLHSYSELDSSPIFFIYNFLSLP